MQYVGSAMLFLGDIPVIGWWAVTPSAIVCGAFFWNALSCLVLIGRWLLRGRKAVCTSKRKRNVFLSFVAGTSVMELFISAYTFLYYSTWSLASSFDTVDASPYMLQEHGYPFLYFLALALILISAVFFLCFVISAIISPLRQSE